MLGKHPKDMTNFELLQTYNVYDSGCIMHQHQIEKGLLIIKEMIKRGIAKRHYG